MLIDTGSQISLINSKNIRDHSLINKQKQIKISSIHGTESTLGNIETFINKNNVKLPIQLQVTNNSALKNNGIIGYDFLGGNTIINGPENTIIVNSEKGNIAFPIKQTPAYNTNTNWININKEIQDLINIEYLSDHELNHQYNLKRQQVRTITHKINKLKIQIEPISNHE